MREPIALVRNGGPQFWDLSFLGDYYTMAPVGLLVAATLLLRSTFLSLVLSILSSSSLMPSSRALTIVNKNRYGSSEET